MATYLLLEQGGYLLTESGDRIILEQDVGGIVVARYTIYSTGTARTGIEGTSASRVTLQTGLATRTELEGSV